jgi:hypothetical protein
MAHRLRSCHIRGDGGKVMTIKRVLAIVCASVGVLGLCAVLAGGAQAQPTSIHSKGVHAQAVGTVKIDASDPRIAWVTGRYSCPAGEAHLWVSVKEMADGRPDPALKQEGSSAIANAWLERHPAPSEFTCDGTWHWGTWQIDSFTEYGFGSLVPGQVYLQFCWTGPEVAPEQPAWFAFDEQFARAQ